MLHCVVCKTETVTLGCMYDRDGYIVLYVRQRLLHCVACKTDCYIVLYVRQRLLHCVVCKTETVTLCCM